MENGAEVAKELRRDRAGGLPWMAILDGDGRELVTSDGPNGNIGCPVSPTEVAWFLVMIERTRVHMSTEQFSALFQALESFAAPQRR